MSNQSVYICTYTADGGDLRERVCLTLDDVTDLISDHPSVSVRKSRLGGQVSLKYAVDHKSGEHSYVDGVRLYDVHQVTARTQKLAIVIERAIGSAK